MFDMGGVTRFFYFTFPSQSVFSLSRIFSGKGGYRLKLSDEKT